ncbi:MAG: ABC-type branched-subunit amino acid transport system ATPase component [Candidatus Aldehydirespiratoraceae bacterium]|jgi:ABC-type branched-subunit amino acid transport system ATPase component/ABC-type branched-subunit amino acid transport system permease subunit
MIELLGIEISQGSIFFGLITGLTYAALAAGFVLIYRSTGVLNFAHGEMGVFGLAIFVMLIVNYGINWWLALFLAVVGSALIGMLIELIVVRRLFHSPRLVLLIATIGVGQILTLARVGWIPDINGGGTVPTAFTFEWEITDHITMRARELTVLIMVPLLIIALGLFLTRTRFGLAVRASASNSDTARVYGTSPRRVSTIVWTIAGGYAAFTAILTAPLDNIQSAAVDQAGNALVEELLLKVLVVSLLARMSSLPGVLFAGLGVGVVEKLVRANVASNPVDLAITNVWFFVAVLVVVLWFVRSGREDIGWTLSPDRRPIPTRLQKIWWVRNLNFMGFAALFGVLAVIPRFVTASSELFQWTNLIIVAIVALSLSVLTGWAGQLSLSQFAFAGVGGMSTVAFTKGHDIPIPFDLFDASIELPWLASVILAVTLGILAAILVGLPALRVRGLFLAVTTLAFAVATSTWLLHQDFFTGGITARAVQPPKVFGFDFDESRQRQYYLCLGVLMLTAWLVSRIRATGIGRTLIAVRDNEEMAAASTVSPTRAKLSAFAVSGGISALAGALFVTVQPSLDVSNFSPAKSVEVVVIAIIGGLGTIAGPILGALWVKGIFLVTPDKLQNLQQLFTSNIGLLVLLMYFPGGLLQIVYSSRDMLIRRAEARWPEESVAGAASVVKAVPKRDRGDQTAAAHSGAALSVRDARVAFGGNVAVDNVSFDVAQGELVGLIGTNGAGKSTLLNAVSGFVPAEGSIEVLGVEVSGKSAPERHRLGLGRGFQAARLYPDLSVRESLMVALEARQHSRLLPSMLGLPPSGRHERQKQSEADEIIDYLGLGRYADQLIGALSTGTRRIVELGSLLAVDARVLLLDEPTGGVAQRETEAFGPLIKKIQQELDASVVVIEHDMPLVMSISDRVYCLEAGSVIAEGAPNEVRNNPLVIASYLGTDERAIQRSNAGD